MKDNETFFIIKVKKSDKRIHKIHLSPPMTPSLARTRILQNKILELDRKKDKYINRYLKKRNILFHKVHSREKIEFVDMTKEERILYRKEWERV